MPTHVVIGYAVTCTSLLKSSFVCIDVTIGFNQTEFTVSEDIGQIQLCLVMIVPASGAISFSIVVTAETQDGTAYGTYHD